MLSSQTVGPHTYILLNGGICCMEVGICFISYSQHTLTVLVCSILGRNLWQVVIHIFLNILRYILFDIFPHLLTVLVYPILRQDLLLGMFQSVTASMTYPTYLSKVWYILTLAVLVCLGMLQFQSSLDVVYLSFSRQGMSILCQAYLLDIY